jgi:hypothetical protein
MGHTLGQILYADFYLKKRKGEVLEYRVLLCHSWPDNQSNLGYITLLLQLCPNYKCCWEPNSMLLKKWRKKLSVGILTILLKVEWRVKHQIFEILLCFLFVCLSTWYVCPSFYSVCSVFLLWMSALFSAASNMSVCPSYLSAQSDLCACSVCLLCLSAVSALSVLSFCSICLQRLSCPPPSPPSKQMWICSNKEQAIWN